MKWVVVDKPKEFRGRRIILVSGKLSIELSERMDGMKEALRSLKVDLPSINRFRALVCCFCACLPCLGREKLMMLNYLIHQHQQPLPSLPYHSVALGQRLNGKIGLSLNAGNIFILHLVYYRTFLAP